MFRERSSARFLSLGPNTSAEPSQSLALLGLSWGLWAWFLAGAAQAASSLARLCVRPLGATSLAPCEQTQDRGQVVGKTGHPVIHPGIKPTPDASARTQPDLQCQQRSPLRRDGCIAPGGFAPAICGNWWQNVVH